MTMKMLAAGLLLAAGAGASVVPASTVLGRQMVHTTTSRGTGALPCCGVTARGQRRARAPIVMEEKPGFFGRMLQGLDDLVDDAMDRKLGNGANFYGKRKSNFYGNKDEMKKADPRSANAEEDYRGFKGGSYFVWDQEWNVPLTRKQARMKKKGQLQAPPSGADE